jgi:hypothetical protein
MEKLEGGRVNGVAAEITVEIRVFFQDEDVHSRPGEQITGHHAGGPPADNEAANVDAS